MRPRFGRRTRQATRDCALTSVNSVHTRSCRTSVCPWGIHCRFRIRHRPRCCTREASDFCNPRSPSRRRIRFRCGKWAWSDPCNPCFGCKPRMLRQACKQARRHRNPHCQDTRRTSQTSCRKWAVQPSCNPRWKCRWADNYGRPCRWTPSGIGH